MLNRKSKSSTPQFKPDSLGCLCSVDEPLFEVVGDKLVSQDFMIVLASAIEGKVDQFSNVISIPELLGHGYYDSLNDEERAIVGKCLVKLIETKRIELHPESMMN